MLPYTIKMEQQDQEWSLKEYDGDKPLQEFSYEPLHGSIWFEAENIVLKKVISRTEKLSISSSNFLHRFLDDDDDETVTEFILANLTVGSHRALAFLGADDRISRVTLRVYKIDDDENYRWSFSSGVGWDYERDRYEKTESFIEIIGFLPSDRFDPIAEILLSGRLDSMSLMLKGVLGLYETPAGAGMYDVVKVLSHQSDQPIVNDPENQVFRTGNVNIAELNYSVSPINLVAEEIGEYQDSSRQSIRDAYLESMHERLQTLEVMVQKIKPAIDSSAKIIAISVFVAALISGLNLH